METTPDPTPVTADDSAAAIEARALALQDRSSFLMRAAVDAWRGVVDTLRFVVFCVYVLLGVVSFWLMVPVVLFWLLRTVIQLLMRPLLYAAEGGSLRSRSGCRRRADEAMMEEAREQWEKRHDAYRLLAARSAYTIMAVKLAALRFWDFSFPRKAVIAIITFFLVFLPGMYLVPRAHYVQVRDNNALNHLDDGARIEYLIHAVDLFDMNQTREYRNENIPWLGKINAQGMKNRIVPGRYYKFWIVGIRWYMPQMYPQLIDVIETDATGKPLEVPSHFIQPTTTGK
jgi:hypothetical protein